MIRKLILEPWQARLHRRSPAQAVKRRPSGWDDYVPSSTTYGASSVGFAIPCCWPRSYFLHQRQFLEDGHGSPRSLSAALAGTGCNHHAVPSYRRVSGHWWHSCDEPALPVAVPHI